MNKEYYLESSNIAFNNTDIYVVVLNVQFDIILSSTFMPSFYSYTSNSFCFLSEFDFN